MYNRQANSFHHYDSSKPYNTSAARSLAKNVEPFLHGKLNSAPSGRHLLSKLLQW